MLDAGYWMLDAGYWMQPHKFLNMLNDVLTDEVIATQGTMPLAVKLVSKKNPFRQIEQ